VLVAQVALELVQEMAAMELLEARVVQETLRDAQVEVAVLGELLERLLERESQAHAQTAPLVEQHVQLEPVALADLPVVWLAQPEQRVPQHPHVAVLIRNLKGDILSNINY